MTIKLRDRLPRLTPAEAALFERAARSLTDASLQPARPASPAWIVFEAEPGGWSAHVAPLRGPDGRLRLTADNGDPDALSAAAAMEQVEPLLAALESVWAVTLRPVRVERECPTAIAVHIEQSGLALSLGIAAQDATLPSQPDRPAPARLSAMRVVAEWRLRGPALPFARLAKLRPGDLMLAPHPCSAILAAGEAVWRGRANMRRRTLTLEQAGTNDMGDAESWAGARTPVEIVIDAGGVAVGRLAELAPGGVLTLDQTGEALQVELRAAGLRIGRGELVAVGDAYGVLLTSVEPVEAAPAETAIADSAQPAEPADA